MKISLVMTIMGADRPGLVDELAAVVAGHEGNWLESRMAHLAGQFAGLLRVEVTEEQAGALEQSLAALDGLRVVLAESGDTGVAADNRQGVELQVLGHDRPGILSEVTRAIAARGLNVEELTTGCESAPMTGDTLFRAKARITDPGGDGTAVEKLREDLERIAADLMVDVEMHAP